MRWGCFRVHEPKTCPPTRKNLPPYLPPMISLGNSKRRVLELLSEGYNPHNMESKINIRRATIQQHLRELEGFGLTSKSNFLWHVTDKGRAYLGGRFDLVGYDEGGQVVPNKKYYDRAHNIKIKVAIIAKPPHNNWLQQWKKNDKMNNNVFYTRRFGEIVTTYTGKNLIFQLPPLTFEDSDTAMSEAGRIVMALIKKYEADVQGLKLGDHDITAQVITQHHAIPHDPFARFCVAHGITFQSENLHVDASKGKGKEETECTNRQKGHLHHEYYVEHMEDVMADVNIPVPSVTAKMINKIVETQYTTNLQLQTFLKILTPKSPPEQEQTTDNQKIINKKPDYIG